MYVCECVCEYVCGWIGATGLDRDRYRDRLNVIC